MRVFSHCKCLWLRVSSSSPLGFICCAKLTLLLIVRRICTKLHYHAFSWALARCYSNGCHAEIDVQHQGLWFKKDRIKIKYRHSLRFPNLLKLHFSHSMILCKQDWRKILPSYRKPSGMLHFLSSSLNTWRERKRGRGRAMYSRRASSLPQGQHAGYSVWFDKQR